MNTSGEMDVDVFLFIGCTRAFALSSLGVIPWLPSSKLYPRLYMQGTILSRLVPCII